ncbi:MAG: hypothetical protein ACI837_002342 [Crocinitomicaceae bacterium]|jgi:hypothetical protein
MKFKGLLASLFVLISIMANAQDWTTDTYKYGELYEGYIINDKGVKMLGYIKYRNRNINQEEVYFYHENNPSTKKKYLVNDLQEFKVGDKTYRCIMYSGNESIQKKKANLLISDGCISSFLWYDRASGYNTMKKLPGESDEAFGNRKFPSTVVYFKTGDDMAVSESFFDDDFVKRMSTYVKDNKELAKKIKAETSGYKIANVAAILTEYNEGCQ